MNSIKITAFLFIATLLLAGCSSNSEDGTISTDVIDNPASADKKSRSKQPEITFKSKVHDFGKVIDGEIVSYSYKFSNTGKADLVITSVHASCGCTVAEYPKEPLAPGEEGYIDVKFDSRRRLGFNHKEVTVMSNTVPNKTVLHMKAKVYRPESLGN